MEDTQKVSESTQQWWIATDALASGGEKVLGPFATRELALEVRGYMEAVRQPLTFWVDQEAVPVTVP